ncbi:DUF6362 family protein [Puniceicoccaceae bacterium K14]|nr:DUF6362 family protein [Puniceicoccaceae bacterium K14]
MNKIRNTHWNEKLVLIYLEDAAAIHRRLPEVKVAGYFNLWPETIGDDWTRLYDAVNGKPRLGYPMPPEVSFQEEVMEWLKWLDRYEQQLVWMRANCIPWKVLMVEFDKSKSTLWRDTQRGLSRISHLLTAKAMVNLKRVSPPTKHVR